MYSLYVPQGFHLLELHAGDLAGHFGQNKTIEVVEHRFYWSSLKKEIAKIIGHCHT